MDLAKMTVPTIPSKKNQLLVWISAEARIMTVRLDAVLLNWKIKMKIDCIIANQ